MLIFGNRIWVYLSKKRLEKGIFFFFTLVLIVWKSKTVPVNRLFQQILSAIVTVDFSIN